MKQYQDFLRHITTTGRAKGDRTGTGTRSVFGYQMRFDLAAGFPLVTSKKVPFRLVVAELLWFLSGSTNNYALRARGCHIWDEWAGPHGELGPIYGHQWRSWPTSHPANNIDQISAVMESIRNNPDSRRHIVSAWNVADIPKMALAPCHAMFQFDVTDGRLSCQLYQRSADAFLGVPFNIASYALLTHMVAYHCGLEVGEFIWTGGDCHIYDNHTEQVATLLSREPRPLPTLHFMRKCKSIFDHRQGDFFLLRYEPHEAIPAPVAV